MRLIAACFAFAMLAGCAVTPDEPLPVDPPDDPIIDETGGCDSEALKYLLGQRITEIDIDSLPHPNRVIPYGTVVTMEYVEGRYNLELDEGGRVARIFCG